MSSQLQASNCLAPRAIRRSPKVKLPAGSWDCHAHVFGPVEHFPYRDVRLYTPPEALLEQYLRLLDTFGFASGVLVQPSVYAYDRSCMTEAISRSNGRLKGVAYLASHELNEEFVAARHEEGLRGVRINAGLSYFNFKSIRDAASAIAPFGWHISLQVKDIAQLVDLEPVCRDSAAKIVVEAMGKMPSTASASNLGFCALQRLLQTGNVLVKLSHVYKVSRAGIPYDDATWIARELISANPDAVIFGSDWPHPIVDPMPYSEDLLDLVLDWTTTDEEREKLWVTNPAKLYDF
jgi:2-pyrone-4,6-dicarboxylate lactonase